MLPVPAPRSGNYALSKIPSWDASFVVCLVGPQDSREGCIGGGALELVSTFGCQRLHGPFARSCSTQAPVNLFSREDDNMSCNRESTNLDSGSPMWRCLDKWQPQYQRRAGVQEGGEDRQLPHCPEIQHPSQRSPLTYYHPHLQTTEVSVRYTFHSLPRSYLPFSNF